MKINILSLFPDYFKSPLQTSILARAQQQEQIEIKLIDIRQFAQDKHQITDLPPYGGGPGMVMLVEPIDRALQSLGVKPGTSQEKIVLTSARGDDFNQQTAQKWSRLNQLTIVCGHYEGVDQRVADNLVDAVVRIGDYVLTGGEPAALVMADAVTRLLPGVLGNADSLSEESHNKRGEISYPQYSRPEKYRGWSVPPVLLSGHHQQIDQWRQSQIKQVKEKSER